MWNPTARAVAVMQSCSHALKYHRGMAYFFFLFQSPCLPDRPSLKWVPGNFLGNNIHDYLPGSKGGRWFWPPHPPSGNWFRRKMRLTPSAQQTRRTGNCSGRKMRLTLSAQRTMRCGKAWPLHLYSALICCFPKAINDNKLWLLCSV